MYAKVRLPTGAESLRDVEYTRIMRIDLGLALALASKANASFRGATGRLEVLAGHPAFARFHDLAFVRQTGLGGEIMAEASVPWFRRLRKEGVARVVPVLSGMRLDKGEDESWGLLTEGDRGLEMWTFGIGRRFIGHDDLQPLRLTLTSGRFDRWSMRPPVEMAAAAAGLEKALEGAKAHLEDGGQGAAAEAVGKYLHLHRVGHPEASGTLASILPDLAPCAAPLFASAVRVLGLLETTGWASAADEGARALALPLWESARVALETAV